MADVVQGSQAWHDQRTNRITGTRFAGAVKEHIWLKGDQWDAMGRDMYREWKKLPQDPFDQRALYAIAMGKENEPKALKTLEKLGYQIVQPSFVVHPKYDWMGMSPDGVLVKGRNGKTSAVEVKCPQTKPCTNVREEKRNYWHQMQLGMECMDIDEMLFFQWYSDTEYHQEWVEREPQWAEIYIPKAKEFIDWYNKACKDPNYISSWSEDKDGFGITYKQVENTDKTEELAEIQVSLAEVSAKKDELEKRKKELAKDLVAENKGSFETLTKNGKVRCHMTQAKGRVNYSNLVKEEKIPYETVEKYRQEGDTRIYTKLIED